MLLASRPGSLSQGIHNKLLYNMHYRSINGTANGPEGLTALDRAATPVGAQEQLMGRTKGFLHCTVESISVL